MIINNNRISIKDSKENLIIDTKQDTNRELKYNFKMSDDELLQYYVDKYKDDINSDIIEKFLNNAIVNQRNDVSLSILNSIEKKENKIFGKVIVFNGERDKFNLDEFPLRLLDEEGNKVFSGEFTSDDLVKKDEAKVVDIYCEVEDNIEILEGFKLTY
ncbi:SLAP domain-containing protein [Oceanirhabdus sp. W0125-5]|uniref:SLAP domain-containing protein n=1 Tax=Oceanirhabdus sp. W0125-5 TaxID=2999116 RepID=UPI0022F34446|nr:SLAP domain-containing protein [Oceanirhabdus sp. W0125-5]WBW98648.1 SLAP domain-containing protein [Oceanirhabdus sp. W0125-5]